MIRLVREARSWLHDTHHAHLLPEPHTSRDVVGAMHHAYPGGMRGFQMDVEEIPGTRPKKHV